MKELYKQLFQKHNLTTNENEMGTYMDSLQKSMAIGSWEVNLLTNTATWSTMTKTIHEVEPDYKPDILEGINFFLEGYNRDLVTKLFNRAVNHQEKYDTDFQLKTAKNNLKWVRIVGYPVIKDGVTVKIIGALQDITDKNNLIKSLELKEKLISTTFEHAPNGMALINLKGEIISLNKSFCGFLGYTKEELIGFKVNTLSHPEDINIIPNNIEALINGTLDKFKCEKRYFRKDGSIIYCILSVSVLRDEINNPIHFISQIIDITERKFAYKKVESLLQTTKNQNEKLLNFAHIVSHNLRSHSGNLEMLLDLMAAEIPEQTKNDFFPLIKEAVIKLSETIQNLNEVSNINSSKKEKIKNINLLQFVNNALGSFRAEILETKASINIDINDKTEVSIIPAYLDSILLNFISNAIKYRRENIKPVINISAKKTKNYIKINIKDNGLGIDLDLHKDKIFGLYKTFHRHEKARGLGLYITKSQIEAMGGKVKVVSQVNKGTKFTIYLKHDTN